MTALILLSKFKETEIEIWRPVVGFDGYEVSNLGRVRSWRQQRSAKGVYGSVSIRRKEPKILKLQTKDTGRITVCLCRDGKRITDQVHQLVAQAFLSKPVSNENQVNHKTGLYVDNRAANLEWATRETDLRHAVEYDLVPHGERNGQAKLTVDLVREIRKRCATGEPQRKTAADFNVSQVTVGAISRRQTWRRVE